jgi:hypothetical protein
VWLGALPLLDGMGSPEGPTDILSQRPSSGTWAACVRRSAVYRGTTQASEPPEYSERGKAAYRGKGGRGVTLSWVNNGLVPVNSGQPAAR